jgi:hypothetical protein
MRSSDESSSISRKMAFEESVARSIKPQGFADFALRYIFARYIFPDTLSPTRKDGG